MRTTRRTGLSTEGGTATVEMPSPRGSDLLACLVVGADAELSACFRGWAEEARAEFESCRDVAAALPRIRSGRFDVVLLALDGTQDDTAPSLPVLGTVGGVRPLLVLAARRPCMDLVLAAMRSGYIDVFALPPSRADFVRALDRVRSALTDRVVPLPQAVGHTVGSCSIVGESASMCEVYKQIAAVAGTDATVALQGETGTGKELVARAIHVNGPRADRPFVAVNCAAVPEPLLESELFGHELGSFTGAVARSAGWFRQADGGTLFLDEIAEMSPALQVKILRAIEERVVHPVGSSSSVPIDIRVVAATNRDLAQEVAAGRFRSDLYHRLAVVLISLPPLAERGDDIDLLTGHFARLFGQRHGHEVSWISAEAMRHLRTYGWPGNVRELRNAIERAVLLRMGDTIRAGDLPATVVCSGRRTSASDGPALVTLEEAERRHIDAVLRSTGGRIADAAAVLGIHRNTLTRRLQSGVAGAPAPRRAGVAADDGPDLEDEDRAGPGRLAAARSAG
jgi:DNA-binding NtrC family response regulator